MLYFMVHTTTPVWTLAELKPLAYLLASAWKNNLTHFIHVLMPVCIEVESLGNTCCARWMVCSPTAVGSRISQSQTSPKKGSYGCSVHQCCIWIWLQRARLLVCVATDTKNPDTGTHLLAAEHILFGVGIVGLDHSFLPWQGTVNLVADPRREPEPFSFCLLRSESQGRKVKAELELFLKWLQPVDCCVLLLPLQLYMCNNCCTVLL